MKLTANIQVLCAALLLMGSIFSSCQDEMPRAFEKNLNGVYFNNTIAGNIVDSTSVTFVYEENNEMQIPVKIQLIGRTSEESRPISITVSSNDALEGTDYTLPATAELPAGSTEVNYIVTLKRTDILKEKRKTINLELRANDFFSLPVGEEVQTGGSVSTLRYRITFSNMFTEPPVTWEEELIGPFSQQKFELICKVLSINPADFNDATIITLAKMQYIHNEMTAYLKQENEKRQQGQDYDTDILDEKTGTPLEF